jgi:hypothetical protein
MNLPCPASAQMPAVFCKPPAVSTTLRKYLYMVVSTKKSEVTQWTLVIDYNWILVIRLSDIINLIHGNNNINNDGNNNDNTSGNN